MIELYRPVIMISGQSRPLLYVKREYSTLIHNRLVLVEQQPSVLSELSLGDRDFGDREVSPFLLVLWSDIQFS